MNEKKIDDILYRLNKSKFRSSFHLNEKMKSYVKEKGIDAITMHAYDFINKRLASAYPENDGHQTPTKNHPVFIAQHACACCCRSCLYKWHHIERGKALTKHEIDYIVNLLITWIKRELKDEK